MSIEKVETIHNAQTWDVYLQIGFSVEPFDGGYQKWMKSTDCFAEIL